MLSQLEQKLREETSGAFEIMRMIGRGGMGAVFLATETSLGRRVALKVLLPDLTSGSGMVERFKREARTAATLDHPGIIPIYRISQGGRLFWYAMKYLEGQALSEALLENGRLPLADGLRVLEQVADALDFAHERGVIHRDVKPANVILDARNRAVVTDFGIAKAQVDTTLTVTGAIVGSPPYMPPEQWSGLTLTGAADQYAFAVMASQVIAGHLPFRGDTMLDFMQQHCMKLPDLKPVVAEFGALTGEVFRRALAKSPATRYSAVNEFVQALGAAIREGPRAPQYPELARSSSTPPPPRLDSPLPGASAPEVTIDARRPGPAAPSGLEPTQAEPPSASLPPPVPEPVRAPLPVAPPRPVHRSLPPPRAAIPHGSPKWRRWVAGFAAVLALAAAGAGTWYVTSRPTVPKPPEVAWTSPPLAGPNLPTGGATHTCLLAKSGKALCWGTGHYSQLGISSRLVALTPAAVTAAVRFAQIDAGDGHTCGVASDSTVVCWGRNDEAQAGPRSEQDCVVSGRAYACTSLPRSIPDLPPMRLVAAGYSYTCGLAIDSLAYCWGSNRRGQLGRATAQRRATPVPVGGVRSHTRFATLGVGLYHACGITTAGAIVCWGWNLYGQLGTTAAASECTTATGLEACSDTPLPVDGHSVFTAVVAGAGHTCALAEATQAFCWGSNSRGQLGAGSTHPKANVPTAVAGDHAFRALAAGDYFTCGLDSDGAAWCWGENEFGQLGSPSDRLATSNVPVRVPVEGRFVSLGAGSQHACGILEGDRVVCWGANGAGQVGNGAKTASEPPVTVREVGRLSAGRE